MKNILKNNKGFTLVEMLVVIIIISVISTAVYQIFQVTVRYNQSLEEMNDYQNSVSDVIYRIRVDLANAQNAESYNVDLDTFNPDTEILDDGYTYIVTNKNGGFTRYWYESGTRKSETFGIVDSAKGYKILGKFSSKRTGTTTVDIVTRPNDATDPDDNTYYVRTTIDLRSSDVDGVIGNAIKFEAN